MTTRLWRGRSQSTPCKLWTRAPRIAMGSSLSALTALGPKPHSIKAAAAACDGGRLRRAGQPGILCGSTLDESRRSTAMSAKKTAPAPAARRSSAALELYEKAVKAVGKRGYD